MSGAVPRQVGLDCTRKVSEQVVGSELLSSVLQGLFQFLASSSWPSFPV